MLRAPDVPTAASSWLPRRDVHVWLPPSYSGDRNRRFPVVYAHDGQRLMPADTRLSWDLGNTLSELSADKLIDEPIVVMIDSVGNDQFGDIGPDFLPLVRRRWLEYNVDLPGPGRSYLSFVCDDLKPVIDATFRTLTAPEHTHALGASLGGTCAFLSMWRRPDVFGNCACFSPVFQAPLAAEVALRGGTKFGSAHRHRPRIYVDNGGDTSDVSVGLLDGLNEGGWWWLDSNLQPGVDSMRTALRLHEERVALRYLRFPGGRHNDMAWGTRAEVPLCHLLRPTTRQSTTVQEDLQVAAAPSASRRRQQPRRSRTIFVSMRLLDDVDEIDEIDDAERPASDDAGAASGTSAGSGQLQNPPRPDAAAALGVGGVAGLAVLLLPVLLGIIVASALGMGPGSSDNGGLGIPLSTAEVRALAAAEGQSVSRIVSRSSGGGDSMDTDMDTDESQPRRLTFEEAAEEQALVDVLRGGIIRAK